MKKKISEDLRSFMEYLQIEKNYSQYTIECYRQDIEHFYMFMDEQGIASIRDCQFVDARLYLTLLYEKQYARNSVSRKISSLRSFYAFLLREAAIERNPFSSISQPKKSLKLPTFFYEDEMEQLFHSCESDSALDKRNRALLEILYATGIRVSECANIRLDDVDFEFSTILIRGKGRKERYVLFGAFAEEALQTYLQQGRLHLVDKQHDHPLLFVNFRGAPLTPRGIRYVLKEMMKKASLHGKMHPHMLRHTFATHLLNNGADMRTVQELLGHSHLSSTQIYTHVTKEHLRKTYLNHHPRG